MKKIFKVTGIVILSIIVLLLGFYLFIFVNMKSRMNKKYVFKADTMEIRADSEAIANGKHIIAIRGCNDCHGADLAGRVINDDGPIGLLSSRNLTKGKGGLPADYSTTDWLRTLRHGVHRDGTPLIMMPSDEYALFTDKDINDIIAYVQSVPAVDHEVPKLKPGPLLYALGFFGKFPMFPVERIDHERSSKIPISEPGSIAQGKYLSSSCVGCHRPGLKGGDPIAPGHPPTADLTGSTGVAGKVDLQKFTGILRTGVKHDGKQMENDNMPWKMTAQYKDVEIEALYKYLKTL